MPKTAETASNTGAGAGIRSKKAVYLAAKAMVRAGLSVIPISADGTKRPAFELLTQVWSESEMRYKRPWSGFRSQTPTIPELKAWFLDSPSEREYGIAVIGGAVSGGLEIVGLEIVDLDNWDVVKPWSALVEKRAPGLLDRLVRVKSPRPGLHVYYRCREFGGSQKLAMVSDPASNKGCKTVIELKGAGGYCVAPPSPAACHKTNRPYSYASALDLTRIPTIEPEERAVLLSCARRLNAWKPAVRPQYAKKNRLVPIGDLSRPGDAFNAAADWGEILIPHGWHWVCETGEDSDQWRRPGKSDGASATTGFGGEDLLYVFSTNAPPFEIEKWYTKFRAYTLLNHGGDFSAAARDLAGQGYGGSRSTRVHADPYERYSGYQVRSWKEET